MVLPGKSGKLQLGGTGSMSRTRGMGAIGPVSGRPAVLLLLLLLLLTLTACSPTATSPSTSSRDNVEQETAVTQETTVPKQAGIIDPTNDGWPRAVRDAFGDTVEIPAQPQRVLTLSLGLDEIVMALTGPERFVAISDIARSGYSNIVSLAEQVPATVINDLEYILGLAPDILLLDGMAQPELVAQARDAGLTVFITDLHDTIGDHLANIELMAYILGEEEAGAALMAEVQRRADHLAALVEAAAAGQEKPRVVHLAPNLYVPGSATTSEEIITRAGGINGATDSGLVGWQQISLEKLVEMAPDVIVHDEYDADRLHSEILEHPAMADVPAVRHGRIYEIPSRYLTTLSFWNIRGAEELARHLWPDALGSVTFDDFD